MGEIGSMLVVFALLCASASLGIVVRERLSERHRARETVELMQITITLLATFAAIVLGLLTTSAKDQYDQAARDRRVYALQLTMLDRSLRNYGPEADAARTDLRGYTAAVIASTWPGEPRPARVAYPDTSHMPRVGASPVLGALMNGIGVEISALAPADPLHRRLLELCLDRYKQVLDARAGVIEDAAEGLFDPFYEILVCWLMIIFLCFGLVAPRNRLTATAIVLSAASLSSVIFVILDLGRPYGGYFGIPSGAMHQALAAMLR